MKKFKVGIDLGGTKIFSAISDEHGNIIDKIKIPTEAEKGKETVLMNIFSSIESLLENTGISAKELMGVGIAVPGPVDYGTGVVRVCPNLPGWINVPVEKILSEKFGTKTYVENDARAAAIAENSVGSGKNFENFIYVTISTGIGGGIIIDGKIHHGANGGAGEIGHMLMSDGSIFEKTASGTAIRELFGMKTEELIEKSENGDETAAKAFSHLIHNLGIGLGNLVTVLNPEAIVIGGGLSNLGDFLLVPLEKEVRKNGFSIAGEKIKLVKAKFNNEAGIIGAISMVE